MQRKWYFPKKMDNSFFQSQMDESNFREEIQDLRTSTSIRQRPIRGENHVDLLGESEGSLPPPHDSFPDAGEAINDFWSMSGNFMYRHNVEPRVKLYSPREESFPNPLKHIDVSRNYTHELGCYARAPHRRLLEYRWVKRLVWFLDRFHSVYSIGRKTSRWICGPGGDWQESSWHPGQITYGQKSGRKWERMPSWRRGKSGHMKKPKLDNARKLRGIYFIDPEAKEFKETIKNARKKLETPVAPAMPCKISKNNQNCGNGGKSKKTKSKLACILEASESTRIRMEESLPNYHEDHIAGKGDNSLKHCNLVHKFIPMHQPLKNSSSKKQQWTKNGKNWRNFRRGTWRKSEVRKRWSMKQGRRAQKFILPHWWTYVI